MKTQNDVFEPARSDRDGGRRGIVVAIAMLALFLGSVATATAQGPEFDNHRQNFNHDADEWVGSEVEGEFGWCGSIDRIDRRDGNLDPATGRAYAVVEGDGCNEYWATFWGEIWDAFEIEEDFASGPFAALTPTSGSWPASGFVVRTDIYLDPHGDSYTDDFDYYVAMNPQDPAYLEVQVRPSDDGALTVSGFDVETTGWHTFLHRFSEDADGKLTVEFELSAKGGPALFTTAVTHTSLFDDLLGDSVALREFAADEITSGYVWLHLDAGERLPIDTYQVRRGQ